MSLASSRPPDLFDERAFGTVRRATGRAWYTNPHGVEWAVHDVRIVAGRRKRFPYGHPEVTHRCFVQASRAMKVYARRAGEVLPLTPSALAQQLSVAEWTVATTDRPAVKRAKG